MQGFTITAEEMAEFTEFKQLKHATEKMKGHINRTNETMQAAIGTVNGNARMVRDVASPGVDDERCSKLAAHIAQLTQTECQSDEEQFIVIGKVRDLMAQYWDEQLYSSEQVSKHNSHRAQTLGKFIEMTVSR